MPRPKGSLNKLIQEEFDKKATSLKIILLGN